MKEISEFENKIILGDCLSVMKEIPNESINCLVTSPPYWGLRDYSTESQIWGGDKNCEHNWKEIDILRKATKGDKSGKNSKVAIRITNSENRPGKPSDFCCKCGAWKGDLGLEPTFDLYISHLCDIFDEAKRVLKKTGACWVVIGDSYAGIMGKKSGWTDNKLGFGKEEAIEKGVCLTNKTKIIHQLPQKCLVQIPHRFAIEMCNRGWILRNTLIWHKNNCMPSSVNDRFTVDFEYVFFFVKQKKYYFKQQFEPTIELYSEKRAKRPETSKMKADYINGGKAGNFTYNKLQPQGRNKRCVWQTKYETIDIETKHRQGMNKIRGDGVIEKRDLPSQKEFVDELRKKFTINDIINKTGLPQSKVEHWFRYDSSGFAYPTKEAWGKLGTNLFPELLNIWYETDTIDKNNLGERNKRCVWNVNTKGFSEAHFAVFPEKLIEPMIKAGCPKDGLVLDPFFGAGTTGVVAKKLGRNYVGIELNPDYIEICKKRLNKTEKPLDNYENS